MTYKVYGTCDHLIWVDGGATPPYEIGDGIDCYACGGRTRVARIEAVTW